MIIEIDGDEYDDYKNYCHSHDIKPKIVYDAEHTVMVNMPIQWVFDWASYITLGECCLDMCLGL